jgi:hypothetical protein
MAKSKIRAIHAWQAVKNLVCQRAGRRENNFAISISFGEVESAGTSTGEIEKPPLRNNAVVPPLLRTGTWCETSKRPRITKSAQEPTSFTSVGSSADSLELLLRWSLATGHAAEILDV